MIRLPHDLVVISDTPGIGVDDWNQPASGTPTSRHVRGFLQSRAGDEVRQGNDAGTVSSTHVAYMPPGTVITPRDRITFDGATYQVRFVGDGRGLHGTAYRRADLFLVTQ